MTLLPPHSWEGQGGETTFIKATEANKTFSTVQNIFDKMLATNLKRTDKIIAIGGGITLDIAAFCASTYKRGCELWFVPTTLIGMIDASIGGKTGVNFGNLKNQIGSFYPASKVILDFDLLKTLPEKETKNGFAELIKMMIISEREFFDQDFDFIRSNLSSYILKAIKYKLNICSKDLSDKGNRQFLNLGHTFAHLFESVSDFNISHGDAVAKGLYLASKYSFEKGLLSENQYHKITSYLKEFCHEITFSEIELNKIKHEGANLLCSDKKTSKTHQLKLVLINDISVEFHCIDDVEEVIDFVLKNH